MVLYKQKTAYGLRMSDWSSDVCSSDLLIGIELIRDLLRGEWFGWMLAGAAFGGSVGLLRERDRLVSTLQRLVMIVLAVLAPVLAAASTEERRVGQECVSPGVYR